MVQIKITVVERPVRTVWAPASPGTEAWIQRTGVGAQRPLWGVPSKDHGGLVRLDA